jgi:hypothetical protein
MTLLFGLELALQVCLHLFGPFLFSPGVEKPALELALGRRPQTLKFDNGMKQIGACGREIRDLSGQLLAKRILLQLFVVLFELADPVPGESLPV